MTAAAPATRLRATARREQLLDAAIELLIERGVSGVSMEGIAAKAGVNKALPYRHFENAQAVLVELFVRFNTVLGTRVLEAVEAHDSIEDRARAAVTAFFDVVREHEVLLSISFSPGTNISEHAANELDAAGFVSDLMVNGFDVARPMARATGELVVGILSTAARSWAEGTTSRRRLEALATAASLAAIRHAQHITLAR